MKDVAIFEDYPMSPRDLIKSFGQYPLEVQAKILVELYQKHLAGKEKGKERTNKASEEIPQYYSIKEIARKMHVSEQTIRNWIKSGKIKCRKIGGSNRISGEDIMEFCRGFDRNLATCLENNINLDKESQEIVPFEKDKIYKIISENKTWVTLFSVKWEQSARFSRKRFEKFFRNSEDWEIDQIKFNLNDLS